MPHVGRRRVDAARPDVQAHHRVGLRARPQDRLPVVGEDRRQPDVVRALRQRDGAEAAFGVAPDLGGADLGIGEPRDAHRDDAVGVRAATTRRTSSRSTPGSTARPSSGSEHCEYTRPQKPVIMRREVHRRPHAVDVHVVHAGVDVPAARAHLVEAERLDLHRLGPPADDRVHARPGCRSGRRTPRPRGPTRLTTTAGARSCSAGGSRPSNMSGGSTRWSSTEMIVASTSRGTGSGRNRSSARSVIELDKDRRVGVATRGGPSPRTAPGTTRSRTGRRTS